MTIWMAIFVMAGITAGIGMGALCIKVRDRHIRLMLGIPADANGDLGELQAKLAAQAVVDSEMKINAAAPHLKPLQRRKLALAFARSRGFLPGKNDAGS